MALLAVMLLLLALHSSSSTAEYVLGGYTARSEDVDKRVGISADAQQFAEFCLLPSAPVVSAQTVYNGPGASTLDTLREFALKTAPDLLQNLTSLDVLARYWGNSAQYADAFTYAFSAQDPVLPSYLPDTQTRDSFLLRQALVSVKYLNVWGFVVRQLEKQVAACRNDAVFISDAEASNTTYWDLAWAVYAGSVGADGANPGYLLYDDAKTLCPDFNTCVTDPITERLNARVNNDLLALFASGQPFVEQKLCNPLEPIAKSILRKLRVAVFQGLIKFVVSADPANTKVTRISSSNVFAEWAMAWAYAQTALPLLDQCDPSAAKRVRENLEPGSSKAPVGDGYAGLVADIERSFKCMSVLCADVGAFAPHTTGCVDEDPMVTIIVVAVVVPVLLAVAILVYLGYLYGKRRATRARDAGILMTKTVPM